MKMVWAYHSEDPVPGLPLAYHGPGQRGARSAFLVLRVDQSAPSREKAPSTWELRNPAVSYCLRSIPRICQKRAARHVYLAPKLPPTAHTHRRGPLARGPHPFRCFVAAPSRANGSLNFGSCDSTDRLHTRRFSRPVFYFLYFIKFSFSGRECTWRQNLPHFSTKTSNSAKK